MGISIHVKGGRTDESKRKPVRTTDGRTPQGRLESFNRAMAERRKHLRKKGYDKGKHTRHVGTIPQEALADVIRNDGPEAAQDTKHVMKRAQEMGFNTKTGGGRY